MTNPFFLTRFAISRKIAPFGATRIPPVHITQDFNGDLVIGSFTPSRYTWSGEQRRGVSMYIADASSMSDHVLKAMGQEFYLSGDIPLPSEITDSLRVISTMPPVVLKSFWGSS